MIPAFKKRFEIVERKGKGHPDTICDLVMDQRCQFIFYMVPSRSLNKPKEDLN